MRPGGTSHVVAPAPLSLRTTDGSRRLRDRDARALRILGRLRGPKPLRASRPDANAARRAGPAGGALASFPRPGRARGALGRRRGARRAAPPNARERCRRRSTTSAISSGASRGSRSATAGPREVAASAAGLRRRAAGPRRPGRRSSRPRLRSLLDGDPGHRSTCVGARRADARARAAGPRLGRRRRSATARTPSSTRCGPSGGTRRARCSRSRREERRRSGISNLARPLQPRLRLLARGRQRAPRQASRPTGSGRQSLANAERFVTPALEGARGEDPRGRRTHRRDRGEALRGAPAGARPRGRPRRRRPRPRSRSSTSSRASPRSPRSGRWVRPKLSETPRLSIVDGRHPIVERLRREEPFVPNDCELSSEKRILVVTGPNMGGKSTYLRQVATIVLLAQAGSFVPAARAELLDRGPDLHAGRRRRSPLARRVDVHGRDARGGRDPARGDAREAS